MKIPRPSVLSAVCLIAVICGWGLTACEFLPVAEREQLARSLARSGDTAGALLIASGHPLAILVGGGLIAAGHTAAGLIRHNRTPRKANTAKRPHAKTGAR